MIGNEEEIRKAVIEQHSKYYANSKKQGEGENTQHSLFLRLNYGDTFLVLYPVNQSGVFCRIMLRHILPVEKNKSSIFINCPRTDDKYPYCPLCDKYRKMRVLGQKAEARIYAPRYRHYSITAVRIGGNEWIPQIFEYGRSIYKRIYDIFIASPIQLYSRVLKITRYSDAQKGSARYNVQLLNDPAPNIKMEQINLERYCTVPSPEDVAERLKDTPYEMYKAQNTDSSADSSIIAECFGYFIENNDEECRTCRHKKECERKSLENAEECFGYFGGYDDIECRNCKYQKACKRKTEMNKNLPF